MRDTRIRSAALLLCVAVSTLRPAAALAESPTEARLRDALRTTTAQLRAADDDRARLQASEAALKNELESLRGKVAAANGGGTSPRELRDLKAKLAEATGKVEEQTEANRQLTGTLAQCQGAAQDATRDRDDLHGAIKSLEERLEAAEAKNARMYGVGKEIIEWLSRKGFGSALAAREPFLGLKRVQLENAAQDYEDKLLDQRIKP
jgi:chromosome segregation ATPase